MVEKRSLRVALGMPPTRSVPPVRLFTSTRRGVVVNAELWKVWQDAATMLDAANCDWRALQQIEGILSSLSIELEGATAVTTGRAQHVSTERRVDSDVRLLQSSLTWVRRHEYDALEAELQRQLDIALRCAMDALDRLEQSPREMRPVSLTVVASGDGR